MITNVESVPMLASVVEVSTNVASTAGVVDGGAPLMMGAAATAGTDEASMLASVNVTGHTANFLGVSAVGFMELARFAGALGMAEAAYFTVDGANGTPFVI